MIESVRKIDGKAVQATVMDGILVCGKCSQPAIPMNPKSGGTPEGYCPKCHLSYIEK